MKKFFLILAVMLLAGEQARAAVGGTITGTVVDTTGAVIPSAGLRLVNQAQHTSYRAVSTPQGAYSFLDLPVGRYDLTVSAVGFTSKKLANLLVDTDATLRLDVTLDVGEASDTITVTSEVGAHIDSTSTHLGEVVSAERMVAIPLNGRSYTDLLSIQPGVSPVSTLLPSSVIMAGVTGAISPSGAENPGNVSISGQRESSNGFLVNGVDVQEHMNGGTSIVPNLDSIEQFRVLTNNFDPEYGNYNGGMISVVTKSGGAVLHGNLFEFSRNTILDARGYFDVTRPTFNQNQFGGTIGGTIAKSKVFTFFDYQGTRTSQGISTGNISVPTLNQRAGIFLNPQTQISDLTGSVSGPYLASLLTRALGRTITSGDPYSAVFPGGVIPKSTWSEPAKHLLQYIPLPNVSASQFSTSAYLQTNRDDKGSVRLDRDTRAGHLSAYYFLDDYLLDNPYPGQQGGASVPGFNALTSGRAQLLALSNTTVVGATGVNAFTFGYLRYANVIGKPVGGLGVSLALQGFTVGPGTAGIYVQAPQFEGVANVSFPSFTMGLPVTNETQINNTYFVSDGFSRVLGRHTVKVGVEFHLDQVNEQPNATFNGTFNINGTETGNPYADFLLGTPSNFTQSSGQRYYLRNHYVAAYGQAGASPMA